MNIVWTTVTVAAIIALIFKDPSSVLTVCVDSSAQALYHRVGFMRSILFVAGDIPRCGRVQTR